MVSVSLIAGNPASRIRDRYQHLMSIQDVDTLKTEALRLAEEGGISDKNLTKFRTTIRGETRLPRLQSYLTNFVLAADGHSVLQAGSRRAG